jgi:SRSO17 transposase
MATKRKPTAPTTEAIDQFCAAFDELFARYEERTALRQYLIGRLLPREHNKTLVELGAIVPGAHRQGLHHFMHDAPRGTARRSIGAGSRNGKHTRI